MKNLTKKGIWWSCVISTALPLLCANAQPAPDSFAPPPGQALSPAPVAVSPAVAEVIRLAESGVGEDVIQAYIQNCPEGFNLTADQILYVRDVGLSSEVISAMLNRDAALRNL